MSVVEYLNHWRCRGSICDVCKEQWGNYFSKYTEGYYGDDAIIYNYVHGTMMIKKLFEDDVIGKAGLQYLVAWSIYRQLAEFTEPYLFRGDRTAEESCFVHVKNVMRLAVLSNYFNTDARGLVKIEDDIRKHNGLVPATLLADALSHTKSLVHIRIGLSSKGTGITGLRYGNVPSCCRYRVAPPYTVEYLKRMAFRIKSSFREALENSTWLTKEARSHLMNKLVQITIQAGSPGDRLYPEFVETFYGQYRLV
ncbi:hypothetical protein HPB51_010713 [Rhipicephalus microplus]|uniref:Uncharacterized protein n=1 Tax=Rhipicephalus microplus TaxID=6941 RepID=A0A9J6F1Y5_RHIMP|nr:hypothetical protein HPB51_010713 [Rhipicephalus microplus]